MVFQYWKKEMRAGYVAARQTVGQISQIKCHVFAGEMYSMMCLRPRICDDLLERRRMSFSDADACNLHHGELKHITEVWKIFVDWMISMGFI